MAVPVSCDPATLSKAATCFCYADPKLAEAVQIYLLALIAGVALDPAELAKAAKCFCYGDRKVSESVKLYLLCQLATDQT